MSAWSVLIPDRLSPPADFEQQELGADTHIILGQTRESAKIPDTAWAAADAVIVWHEMTLDASVIAKLVRCKVIVRCGVGFDNVDLEAAGRKGIPVCNVPDYGTADVADHSMALLLSLMRGLPAFDAAAREPRTWVWTSSAGVLRRIAGARLGLIGLGRIGSAVALRAKAFGMHVRYYDPYLPDGYDKVLGIERAHTLDDLLPELHAVSFHVPLTDETRGMGSAAFFAKLSPGTVLINTARGGLVQLDALEEAMRSGQVGAAGLDVLSTEPASQADPLIAAWHRSDDWIRHRLIISPHAAFYCAESYEEMRRKAARTVREVLTGQPPRNAVNQTWLM